VLLRCTISVIATLVISGPAFGNISWDIQCGAGQTEFEISVGILNQYVQEGEVDGYELLFEQSTVGSCDDPEVFMAVPLHSPLTYAEYSFTRPANELNQYYLFNVRMKLPDGSVQSIGFPGAPSWNVGSCGDALAARGYLVSDLGNGDVEFQSCTSSCSAWPCATKINLGEIPEELWRPFIGAGIPVDIWGRYILIPMPGGSCLYGGNVLPTTNEACGTVATEGSSWGSAKARYR